MANFLEYNPEQAYLLPPTVREVLGGVRGGWSSAFGKIWRFAIWRAGRSRIFGR